MAHQKRTIAVRSLSGLARLLIPATLLLAVSPVLSSDEISGWEDTLREVTVPSPWLVGPDVPLLGGPASFSPPDNPQVGDSWTWWLWVHDPMPPHFEQTVCTVRGKSDRGYVVVRDSDWLVSMDQADVDKILEAWESSSPGPFPEMGIYEIDSMAFGVPPDELDNDPRIYQVWFDFNISADGFFFWFDELPEGATPGYHSNECEVVYLNSTSQGGPGGDYMNAVTTHELEHMIHWKYDDDETSWVDEGLAELAMWFYGHPDVISGFSGSPDNSLIVWTGSWADYIKTYLWSLYFYERYGGLEAIFSVLHQPANSIAGYEAVLDEYGYSEDFEDVFADWIAANFLSDTSLADGRFGYAGADLPAFNVAGTYSSYPVASVTRTVNYWAADYYRFQGLDPYDNLLLSFDGSTGNSFAVWGFVLHGSGETEVHRMTVDPSTQDGALYLGGLTGTGDQVILAVGSASSTGPTGYSFSAEAGTGIEGGQPTLPPSSGIQAFPNPFSDQVSLTLAAAPRGTQVDVYDLDGRLVRTLLPGADATEGTTVVWDGLDASGEPASPGVYFAVPSGSASGDAVRLLRLP
jgi:hypothetical protein